MGVVFVLVSLVTTCRMGQETVQEIVAKTSELFQTMKNIQVYNIIVHVILWSQNFSRLPQINHIQNAARFIL